MADHEWDEGKLCDAALALLSLTLHDEDRVWKGLDWSILSQLHERGWISDPVSKAKSVRMTPDGLRRAEAILKERFSTKPARRTRSVAALDNDPLDHGDRTNAVVIRCTARLLKELRVKPLPVPPSIPIERDWHANLVRMGARKSVLIAHSTTLYTALLLHVKRPVLDDFGTHFHDQARCTLGDDGFTDHERVLPTEPPRILYAKTNNRSVLGSLNDLAYMLAAELEHVPNAAGVGFPTVCRRLNRIPMIGTLGGSDAIDAMGRLLGHKANERP